MALKKYNFNLEEELISKVDDYAKKIGINRTAAVSVLIAGGLQMAFTPDLIDLMKNESKKFLELKEE